MRATGERAPVLHPDPSAPANEDGSPATVVPDAPFELPVGYIMADEHIAQLEPAPIF